MRGRVLAAGIFDAGARVIVVDGEPTNIHITTPEELALANHVALGLLPADAY